jgi:hypothetical protein
MSAAELIEYNELVIPDDIRQLITTAPFEDLIHHWQTIESSFGWAGRRALARIDRFYLLVSVLHRPDAMDPWLYARCREVEADPDDHLDLWAREHYKSTIITFAGIIQEVINDPEITIGIFSHTKAVSRKFLNQIKFELESNQDLYSLFPDVFWSNPKKMAPRWSLDTGLVMKRNTNPKEATIEAHGLVDGMPTGAHFRLRVYDDVVTRESVTTPEQVAKTTEAWELSDNLGAAQDDGSPARRWHIGTRYSFADTYGVILERGILKARIYPATHDGSPTGNPVFLSRSVWLEKVKTQGPETLACQMLQNPLAGAQALFDQDHLRFVEVRPETLNIYIMVDPASSKKKGSDNTAIAVVGIDSAWNKYLLDGYYQKMSLPERWNAIKSLRRYWMAQRGVQGVWVGYERYGMRSDIEHFEEKMEIEGNAFEIKELAWPTEGPGSKYDRIQRLYADFSQGRFHIPLISDGETKLQRRMREIGKSFLILQPTRRKDHLGKIYSLNKVVITEYLSYPYSVNDDFLDALSRIYDMDARPPVVVPEGLLEPEEFIDG